MICPICGHENLQGADNCDNCGSDLRTVDIPTPGTGFEARLLKEHLDSVGAAAPLLIDSEAPLTEALRLMQEARNGCVLAMRDGHMVGLFTERDALLKVAGRPLDGIRVADVMTADPVMLRPEDSVAVALHKMAVGGFRHVPLVEDGRPVGVATARDLLRHIDHLLG